MDIPMPALPGEGWQIRDAFAEGLGREKCAQVGQSPARFAVWLSLAPLRGADYDAGLTQTLSDPSDPPPC